MTLPIPYYDHAGVQLFLGDCLNVMPELPDNSVDSIITDPPYALTTTKGKGFMGKEWDGQIPGVEVWKECLRVAKPGAMMLCFGGDRTHHRLMCAIEDAGWEIRTCLYWAFGSGFPKSNNISRVLDKSRTTDIEIESVRSLLREKLALKNRSEIADICGVTTRQIDHWVKKNELQPQIPSKEQWAKLQNYFKLDDRSDIKITWINLGRIIGRVKNPITWNSGDRTIYAPATDAAKKWDGYGTALKPAVEIIVLAMKPLDGTFAQNALKWGVAGLNIDGARVEGGTTTNPKIRNATYSGFDKSPQIQKGLPVIKSQGRWPANLLLSYPEDEYDKDGNLLPNPEKDEVVGVFPVTKSGAKNGVYDGWGHNRGIYGDVKPYLQHHEASEGSTARFFKNCPPDKRIIYCPKASRAERGEGNVHATVKPVALIEYLCTLTRSPDGGVVLDPFAGSGTTGVACRRTGRKAILIEKEREYCEISAKRLQEKELPLFPAIREEPITMKQGEL